MKLGSKENNISKFNPYFL